MSSAYEIFAVFLRLGLTSFGGPIAHLAYFRDEFVVRRQWLGDRAYADLVALCQFLPGPASSQVGIAIGFLRGGFVGASMAWLGFILPSAICMFALGSAWQRLPADAQYGWLHGLKVAAVAVVAQALWGMGKSLCPDRRRASLAVMAAVAASAVPGTAGQIAVILAAALTGAYFVPPVATVPHAPAQARIGMRGSLMLLGAFAALLILLPLHAAYGGGHAVRLFDVFYRTGALVFGGGHVVLPLLEANTVSTGWVGTDTFLAGYGAAQALPGPLFTFAAFLGTVSGPAPNGWLGASIAVVAIFLPGFLLVLGALPLWERARRRIRMQRAMLGINAAVVGLLLAAFYRPVWTSAILVPADFALAIFSFLLLVAWRAPAWAVVSLCALAGGLR